MTLSLRGTAGLLRHLDVASGRSHVQITPARGLVWTESAGLTTLVVLSLGALPRPLPTPLWA